MYCFDSNFVIWGINEKASPGQEENIRRAQYVVSQCREQDIQIAVPSIVLAELLSRVPQEIRRQTVNQFERRFVVLPFDSRAALVYARMWQNRIRSPKFSRSETKADYLIAAIAVASGCLRIYSNDAGLRTFAEDHISVFMIDDIHPPPEQMGLI